MPKLIYIRSKPVPVEFLLAPPMVFVEVGGQRIDQPICQAPDDSNGIPVWAAVVNDETHAAISAEPEFLGAGLSQVKEKAPDIYDLITIQVVEDPQAPGGKAIVRMGEKAKSGQTVLAVQPGHTFAGWDPMTGDPVS